MFGCPCFSLSSVLTGAESLTWFPWNGTSIFLVCCYCCCLEGKQEGKKREKRKINRLVLNLWVLAKALGFPSVISIDYFTAWQIRIQIYFSKYHVCWGNGCHTRTILLKRLTQYPIEKPICYLFMTDWCCWCGVAAYTCRKAFLLNAYSPSNSPHLVNMQCLCRIMQKVTVYSSMCLIFSSVTKYMLDFRRVENESVSSLPPLYSFASDLIFCVPPLLSAV